MKVKPDPYELCYDTLKSPLGTLWIVSSTAGLSYLFLRGQSESELLNDIQRRCGTQPVKNRDRHSYWLSSLSRYFSGEAIAFEGPIAFLEGTAFQKKVWQTLCKIPYGALRSYQWVGNQLSLSHAGRAVGNACGKNPIPIVVPCHRVVRQDGALGGYTGGTHIKKRLLEIEGSLCRYKERL